MSARRRLITVLGTLGLCVAAGSVTAQPKKADAKKADAKKADAKKADAKKADAKDAKKAPPPAPVTDPVAGEGSGSAAPPAPPAPPAPDEPPPKDMEGKDENPDAPKGGDVVDPTVPVVPVKQKKSGYPTEETLRPITLPQNMSEIAIAPHLQASPFESSDALRARYGITREVQLGLTYVLGGVFHEPTGLSGAADDGSGPLKFKPGKAVGLDVTVLLQDWIGIKVGVPIYIDPVAVSIAVGVPIKFSFADGKLAIGGLDDLFAVRVKRFTPSFYQEAENARNAFSFNNMTNETTSRGYLKFSAYGIYQQDPKLAILGRIGFTMDNFSASINERGHGGEKVFIRGGFDYAVRHWCDLGASLGWDDLSNLRTFAPQLSLAIRI